jgi:hypothetical protein
MACISSTKIYTIFEASTQPGLLVYPTVGAKAYVSYSFQIDPLLIANSIQRSSGKLPTIKPFLIPYVITLRSSALQALVAVSTMSQLNSDFY